MSTVMISVRLEEELYQYLRERAERENRTLSNTISTILLEAERNDDWRSPCDGCTLGLDECKKCRKRLKWINGKWEVVES